MMKRIMYFLLAALCAFPMVGAERKGIVSEAKLPVGKMEIVVEPDTPLLKFAAGELQRILKEATGRSLPVVKKPTPGTLSLILGDSSFARAAGVNVSELPDEGYRILRKGSQIILAGKDDPVQSPEKNFWNLHFPRATLSAVYDFLERFLGVRFYLPGEYGTIVPKIAELTLPEKIDILERPDNIDRRYYSGNEEKVKWYETSKIYNGVRGDYMNFARLRMSEMQIPFCHGLAHSDFVRRFGKSHPEYFALTKDGERYCGPEMEHPGQLCFNSEIREEVFQDAVAYLTGKPAASRGMKWWSPDVAQGRFYCVMPQDGMYWCDCEKCRKIANAGYAPYENLKDRQSISNFIWKFTSEIANRLTKAGIHATVTQMAYLPYDLIPECEIPKNVLVKVAVNGRGENDEAGREDTAKLKLWSDKTGPVSTWTYAVGKHMGKNIPGIPAMMPKHVAHFIKVNQKYICGEFCESETDHFIFNYLNYYVLGKVLWNSSIDVDALLDEHYTLMFGKGARYIKSVFESLEEKWTKQFLGHTDMTSLGPAPRLPSILELWTRIYSPEVIRGYDRCFAQAEEAAANEPDALKRIRFMRKEFLGPLKAAAEEFQRDQAALDSWSTRVPGTIYLRPLKGEVNEVQTAVRISRTDTSLEIEFDCAEPRMKEIVARQTRDDAEKTYEDSCVEVLLNPSGDRKNYYHFIANANGALTDYRCRLNEKADSSWNSGAEIRTVKKENGFTSHFSIPLKALGKVNPTGFPANFARHRSIVKNKPAEIYYQWSPLPGQSFHDIELWGKLDFASEPVPIIRDGAFEVNMPDNGKNHRYVTAGKWGIGYKDKVGEGQRFELDSTTFIKGGKSLHFVNKAGKCISAGQCGLNLKPNTKYRLSYYLRTKNLIGTKKGGAGAFIYFTRTLGCSFPYVKLTGTNPWHRLTFEFTTPAELIVTKQIPVIGLWIWDNEGEAWFDDVRIEEIQ